jgi:recombination associated protein RdgC
MWFKNIQLYEFTEKFDFSPERFETALQEQLFAPCPSILPMSSGWIAPIGTAENSPLVHHSNGLLLIQLKIEEKIIPASVVNNLVKEKVSDIETKQSRRLSSKERLALKDEVYGSLLPRAFSKHTLIKAFLDPKNKHLIVDASTRAKAEEFNTFLRKTLGSLPIALPKTKTPAVMMTKWLKSQNTPKNFHLVGNCLLYDAKVDGGTVRCSKHDLLSPNIQAFVKAGMEVIELQLQWKEHLRFTLKEDFAINSVKFTDAIFDLAKDAFTENPEQEQETSFVIMSQTVLEFIDELLPLFNEL